MRIWLFLILLLSIHTFAIDIVGFDPARHERFAAATPSVPENPNFFAAGFDWSGVGWGTTDTVRGLTMISPQHFVAANHFRPANPGGTVSFLSRDNVIRSFTVANYTEMFFPGPNPGPEISDLVMGTLAAPIDIADNIGFYSVVQDPNFNNYIGSELLVHGQHGRTGRNTLENFAVVDFGSPTDTFTMLYVQDAATGFNPDEAFLTGGDSGSPTMMVHNGELTVLGTHMGIDPPSRTSFDSFIPFYIDQLNAAMAGDGFSLSIIAVPEPSSTVLIILGFLIFFVRQRIYKRI